MGGEWGCLVSSLAMMWARKRAKQSRGTAMESPRATAMAQERATKMASALEHELALSRDRPRAVASEARWECAMESESAAL